MCDRSFEVLGLGRLSGLTERLRLNNGSIPESKASVSGLLLHAMARSQKFNSRTQALPPLDCACLPTAARLGVDDLVREALVIAFFQVMTYQLRTAPSFFHSKPDLRTEIPAAQDDHPR